MNKNNNDLNKFFKSRLEDTTPADNGWNVPPMSILDDALDQLPQPPKRNKLLIPFVVLGLAAIGLTSLIIFNSMKISKLNEKIETLSVSENQTTTENNSTSVNEDLVPDVEPTQTDEEVSIVSPDASSSTQEPAPITEIQTKNGLIIQQKQIQSSTESNLPRVDQTPVETKRTSSSIFAPSARVAQVQSSNQKQFFASLPVAKRSTPRKTITKENLVISMLPLLHALAVVDSEGSQFGLNLDANLSALTTDGIGKIESESKRKFTIIFSAGYLGSDVRMTNINPSAFSLTEYDDLYPGFGFNVGVSTPLSKKFNLSTTLGYNTITNRSLYESDFIYYENNTIPTSSGGLVHLSTMAVETPMGQFSDDLALRLRESNITNGEMLDQFTDIFDHYQILQFSTALSYEVLRLNKLSLHTGIGFSGNYILDFSQTLDTEMHSNSSLMMDKTIDTNHTSDINRLFLSGRLNLELQYAISETLFIKINASYDKGLTSIRKQNSNTLPQSYLNSVGTAMTLGYSF